MCAALLFSLYRAFEGKIPGPIIKMKVISPRMVQYLEYFVAVSLTVALINPH